MKLKHNPVQVEANFRELMLKSSAVPNVEAVREFVEANFTLENQMEDHLPEDWTANPKLLANINDLTYSLFAQDINARWKMLCRKISTDVEENPDLYTLLYLPNPVIVPGGRFREIYYWDSYWIILGLLHSEMFSTVKGMLNNCVHLIREFGLIPNGGRSYYLNRSQPPLFIQMVKEYETATGDKAFVKEIIDGMDTEFEYWHANHIVPVTSATNGRTYSMVRYCCEHDGPRPESYAEDFDLVREFAHTEDTRQIMYWELKTGAESGWDYSSRWYAEGSLADKEANGETSCNHNVPGSGDLQDTRPRQIIPVELNSYFARNARIMAEYHRDLFDDQIKASYYERLADDLTEAVEAVLWDEEDGIWYDYDFVRGQSRKAFTPSNLVPLWSCTMTPERRPVMCQRAVQYTLRQNIDSYSSGFPTTFTTSGQQWDFPNSWPPLVHLVVHGLERTELPEAKDLAFTLAEKLVRSAYLNFQDKGHMFEKYSVLSSKTVGGGGEYEVQLGFGWTNGVVLDFLNLYGDRLSFKAEEETPEDSGRNSTV